MNLKSNKNLTIKKLQGNCRICGLYDESCKFCNTGIELIRLKESDL
jgi:hypothetical protein